MSFYTFCLDQFRIDNTRARHNDTDVVAISLKVGGRSFSLTSQMGDRNNGNHDVGLEFPAVQIDNPNTAITLKFSIVNAGHDKAGTEAALKALDSIGMGIGGVLGLDKDAVKIAMASVDVVLAGLLADCDGTVAADELTALRADFDKLIPANGRVSSHTKFYPGTDSPFGCGGNSQYYVTLTLLRTEAGDIQQPDLLKAFIILSRSSGLVLDVPGFSTAEQTPIQQFPDNGGRNQHWQLVPVDNGFFQVRSLSSGLLLDVTGASHDDHALIQQFHGNGGHNQHWQFIPVPVPPPVPLLPGGSLFFKIRSRLSGKVMDVPGRSAAPQAKIQQYADNGGNNQLWQLISVADL